MVMLPSPSMASMALRIRFSTTQLNNARFRGTSSSGSAGTSTSIFALDGSRGRRYSTVARSMWYSFSGCRSGSEPILLKRWVITSSRSRSLRISLSGSGSVPRPRNRSTQAMSELSGVPS